MSVCDIKKDEVTGWDFTNMTRRQYDAYNYHFEKFFQQLLPYKTKSGIHITTNRTSVNSTHGIFFPDCGINWDQPEDGKRYIAAVKFHLRDPFAETGYIHITGFNIESLELMGQMARYIQTKFAERLLK